MKRDELIKKIKKAAKRQGVAWAFDYHGANHDLYLLAGKKIPIERHAELDNRYAEKVYKECEEVLGKGWWR